MSFFHRKNKKKIQQKSWQRRGMAASSSFSNKEEKKGRKKFSRFLFWLLLAGFWGICAYLLLFSPFLEIDSISVEGNQEILSADIMDGAAESLEGKFLGVFSRKNYFLASRKNITGALKNRFNRLEVEVIEKRFPNAIWIKVTERKAELVWCSAGVCYFVDKGGLAYGGAENTEDELQAGNFLVAVDDSARPVEIGKTKISPEYILRIEEANAMIRNDLKIEPVEVYHTPGMASQEISASTGEGWILKISLENPIEESKKIIQTLFEKELNEEARKNLDYLDLRVRGKVYYKTK